MNQVNSLAVVDKFCKVVLPAKVWDGTNRYCSSPGREGSEYSDDLASLWAAREAIAQVFEKAVIAARALEESDSAVNRSKGRMLLQALDWAGAAK